MPYCKVVCKPVYSWNHGFTLLYTKKPTRPYTLLINYHFSAYHVHRRFYLNEAKVLHKHPFCGRVKSFQYGAVHALSIFSDKIQAYVLQKVFAGMKTDSEATHARDYTRYFFEKMGIFSGVINAESTLSISWAGLKIYLFMSYDIKR